MKMKIIFIVYTVLLVAAIQLPRHSRQAEVKSPPGFIATFPATVIDRTNVSVCLQFINVDEYKSNLTIKIDDDGSRAFKAIEAVIPFESLSRQSCFNVSVNDDTVEENEDQGSYYHRWSSINQKWIMISGQTADGSYKFSDKKSFNLNNKQQGFLGFAETDKPVYKPGQKVQIRVLTLDYELRAKPAVIYQAIKIIDPSKSVVEIWKNLSSKTGLLELEFELSNEPNLGVWSIEVLTSSEQNGEKIFPIVEFEVKNYVLPKFEVLIKKLNSTSDSITIEACALYSFGKPVKGQFILQAFPVPDVFSSVDQIPTYVYNYFKTYHNLTLTFRNLTLQSFNNGKGCETFIVPTSSLSNLPNTSQHFFNRASMSYMMNVTLVEHGTDLEAKSSATFRDGSDKPVKSVWIKLLEPSYYKPGLPVPIKLKMTSSDGQEAVANRNMSIRISIKDALLHQVELVSDELGLVQLVYNIPSEHLAARDRFESIEIKVKSGEASGEFTIKPWFSKSGIYMQLYQKSSHRQLKCDSMADYELRIAFPGARLLKANIFLHLQARHRTFNLGYLKVVHDQVVQVVDSADRFELASIRATRSRRHTVVSIVDENYLDYHSTQAKATRNRCDEALNEGAADNATSPSTRWHFNKTSGQCEHFKYLGSRGSKNNFQTPELCESACNRLAFKKLVYPVRFKTLSEISPEFNLLAFFLDDNEIVMDHLRVDLDAKCLSNQVELKLGKQRAEVGEKISLKIQSDKNSVCALSAIDKSVTFLGKKQNSLDLEKVFAAIGKLSAQQYNFNSYPPLNDCSDEREDRDEMVTALRHWFPTVEAYFNPVNSIKKSNMVILSDYQIAQECLDTFASCRPPFCRRKSSMYARGFPGDSLSFRPGPLLGRSSISTFELSGAPRSFQTDSIAEIYSPPKKPTIREFFPETWLWSLQSLNEKGALDQEVKVPDTITDWHVSSYCLSPTRGLGISSTQTLKVFQTFFLLLNLPHSVVSQEIFPVKVKVFNYMDFCTPVKVYVSFDSKQFRINGNAQKALCSCPHEPLDMEFSLQALKFDVDLPFNITAKLVSTPDETVCDEDAKGVKFIKFSDSEKRSVIVEPEGFKKEKVINSFVVLKDDGEHSETIDFELPQNIVPKSERVYLKVLGDLMGNVLNNLDHLVQQPYGCGEQNMAKLAPIISVLDYLSSTDQLTDRLQRKALSFLKSGYQRQLTYSHPDGLYSAFGKSDADGGGTWLSAFVLRYFVEMSRAEYVPVDLNNIVQTYSSLLNTQSQWGAFRQMGSKLFSKALAGAMGDSDTSDDGQLALTAYVLVSLTKAHSLINKRTLVSFPDDQIRKAFEYLKDKLANSSHLESFSTYTLAVAHYALNLENEQNRTLLDSLDQVLQDRSVDQDGLVYWKSGNPSAASSTASESADMEVTSYVLLARVTRRLKQPNTKEGPQSLLPTVKWINSKRNSFGGFYSTQDTVVALEALSKYASLFHVKQVNLTATFDLNENQNSSGSIAIDQNNRLKVNTIRLTSYAQESNELNLHVRGVGSLQAQIVLKYSVRNESAWKPKFEFSVIPLARSNNETKKRTLSIAAKYLGDEGGESGMAMALIKLPSGYVFLEDSLKKLESSLPSFKRFEILPGSNAANLYFESMAKSELHFEIEAIQEFEVENLKPGYMHLYDYYEPIDEALIQSFEF